MVHASIITRAGLAEINYKDKEMQILDNGDD
jgi:hypothetical protein